MMQRFLHDDHARIPFSVIGVFLILGSSFTTIYISQLEMQKASEIAGTIDFNEIENLIRYAEADIATALNIVGMKGLKKIGKEPVLNVCDPGNNPYGSTPYEVNQNRCKEIIMQELNVYLTSNYLYDMFNDGRYAINVVILDGETYPITSMHDITFSTMDMHLTRPHNDIPLIDGIIGPKAEKDHMTYSIARVPIDIEIGKLDSTTGESKAITIRTINTSSIITSRFPLLDSLVEEYIRTINQDEDNWFPPLWTFTTILANIYSLARGYKHYSSGKPLNVVDNRHLALVANGGLLLEQGLVFSSVDPLSIIDFAIETGKTLRKTSKTPLSTFNEDMIGTGFDFDPSDLSQGSANTDAGDDFNTSFDECPYLNLSEIAERVLYDIVSVMLVFENDDGDVFSEAIDFTGDIEEKISDAVSYWANNSYFLNDTIKNLKINETTISKIHEIAAEMYHSGMSTQVSNRQSTIIPGVPGPGWTDNGYSIWNYIGFTVISKNVVKPEKGLVAPGCVLYDEKYNVSQWRTHYYYRDMYENISGNWTWVRYWNNVTDLNFDEVTLQVILDRYAAFKDSQDDVVDVLYFNATVDDPDLEDTLVAYISAFPDSNSDKQNMIRSGTVGYADLYYCVPGIYNSWIEIEAWGAMNDILMLIGDIQQDPSINSTRYPNPIILMQKVKEDLLSKYSGNVNLGIYHNLSAYQTGSDFSSVGKKAVYYVRDWYVYKVKDDLETVFSTIEDKIDEKLGEAIADHAPGLDADKVKDALSGEAMETLSNQFSIPFGFDINLDSKQLDKFGNPLWNETVRLAVDQYPNYLDAFNETGYNGVNFWSLGVKNICTLGPTGFPILPPTPVTPWIVTINVWVIDVKGEYAEFKVIDSSDETLFNPLFGHDPQIYLRKNEQLWNEDESVCFGDNTRLNFSFTTVAFGVVPSWGMMVGDIAGGWEEKDGSFKYT